MAWLYSVGPRNCHSSTVRVSPIPVWSCDRQQFSWHQAEISIIKGRGTCLWDAVTCTGDGSFLSLTRCDINQWDYRCRVIGRDENGTGRDTQPFTPVVVLSLLYRRDKHNTHTYTFIMYTHSFSLIISPCLISIHHGQLITSTAQCHSHYLCILLCSLSLSLSLLISASLSFTVSIIHLSLLWLCLSYFLSCTPVFSPLSPRSECAGSPQMFCPS